MKKNKNLWSLNPCQSIITALLILLPASIAFSQQTPACCAPSFAMEVVKPNILICLDMTGSMQFLASRIINNGQYDPNRRYYGYFDPDSVYYYRSGVFYKYRGSLPPNSKFPFPGNIMNWMIMSRIDVARKALVGGKGLPLHSINKHTLQAEARNLGWPVSQFGWPCTLSYSKTGITYRYRIEKPSLNQVRIVHLSGIGPDSLGVRRNDYADFVCDIDVVGTADTAAGVIRQIGDKNLDCDWDQDAPRFALMFFSTDKYTAVKRTFYQSDSTPDMEPFFNCFNEEPMGGTNTGDAVLQ